MEDFSLSINGKSIQVNVPSDMPLLWVLRDVLAMKGTKYGCGQGLCGSCTVLLDGNPIRTCAFPVGEVKGAKIVTIEGISEAGDHPVQKAWVEHVVPQCGYCQSGQIMSAVALLDRNPNPSDQDIESAMSGNICRCGTYNRIKEAIQTASKNL
ncbi:(2Fe-2S)-binding protein [Algoriphagus mannitolivorans]|uniref:(2Fe-2S)-binding protein n=1 Tax=Algoriphagus mannitolivorans TaxID=226504 RepID=UPI0003F99978|nr:(2Fe-2S)-binding protein [Algoriphagus mannitolivorans]